jgi:hypothetical protein
MKVRIIKFLALSSILLLLPAQLLSAELSVDSATIVRIEKRDIPGADKRNITPATQFLGIDAAKIAGSNFSLHFYGWGRADLGDRSYNRDKTDGGFTYGYLRYRFDAANADTRAGRFFVREGIVNEQVDGLSVRSDLPGGFGISAFGGATVHNRKLYRENNDGKGDYLFGGRFNYRMGGVLDLGLSGVYEDAAPELQYHRNGNHRLVGGDIWFTPLKRIELIGHSSYDTETSGFAEHAYLLTLKPLQQLTLNASYDEQRERRFFQSWAMFSGALTASGDRSRSIGTVVSWQIGKEVEIAADYKHYSRERGSANRYGGDLKLLLLDNSLRGGIGYHYLSAGESFAIASNPSASYHEIRGYALHDTKAYFAALDLTGYFFKDKIYDEKSALEGTLSIGYHITPLLALSGDVSHGRNPEFTEETKGLVRLTYNPVFGGKGEKK